MMKRFTLAIVPVFAISSWMHAAKAQEPTVIRVADKVVAYDVEPIGANLTGLAGCACYVESQVTVDMVASNGA
jgi:hypothetical protein